MSQQPQHNASVYICMLSVTDKLPS